MASREINILIKAKDLASGAIKGVKRELGGLEKIGGKAARNAGQNIERGIVAGGVAAAAGLAYAVKTAASFEQAFAGVEKTVEATDAQFKELEDTIRSMAREGLGSFEELAAIGEAGGALGVDRESLDEFIDVVARLGMSTDLTTEAASTALGQLGNVLQLTGSEYEDFSDILVALGNDGASTEAQIIDLAARFGAAGMSAGLTNEQILTLASTTASMGIEAEAGGGALSRIFNNLTLDMATASEEGELLASTLGMSLDDLKKAWGDDAGAVFEDLLAHINELDQFEGAQFLSDLGITNTRDINAIRLLSQGVGEYRDQLATAEGANGALREESDKFLATTERQWFTLQQNVRDTAATIGTALLPVVNELVSEFVDWLQTDSTQTGIKEFAEDLADNAREVAKWLQSLDWNAIGSALGTAAGAGKALLDAFLAMPPWVQGLLAGGFAVNKFTGGALGDLIGLVGQGVIKGVMNMNAGVVNINAATVNGGGGVPGAAGRAGGGFAGALGRGLVTGGVVGGAAALTAGAAVTVHNFEQMRGEQREKLQGILDELPRTPERIDRSIEAIREQISMERPLLEGVLFNTNIKPQLEAELQKLEEVKGNQLRAEIAIRDAIPWHQRNVEAVHNLNAQEGARHSHLTGLQQSQVAAVRAMHGPLSTIAAKDFSPRIAITTHVNSFVSVNEWQRVARSAQTSYSTNTGGI